METSNDCFVAALQKKLKEQGRGSKKKLAASVGVSPNHLSDILAQRKNAGQKLKERIADTLHMSFEDMLVFGRRIVEGRENKVADNVSGRDLDSNWGRETLGGESIDTDTFMAMAREVLESNTPYRQALVNNLTAFYQALETINKEEKALQMIASLQKELKSMRRDIEELKQSENGESDFLNTPAA